MRGVVDKSSKAMGRAKEIQEILSLEHPSFIRAMRRSHVTVTFYMCPPTEFCRKYLPKDKEIFVLEVESGKSYDIKYLGSNCAFSAGWRQFAIAEKLVENDVLVFHLIKPCKFKVYIVRGRELANVDRASTSNEIDDCAAEREVDKNKACVRDKKRRRPVQINSPREELELNGLSKKSSIHTNNRKSLETIPDFKNFKIVVDGTSIELPHQVREGYYKLCCSQKSYLHCHLINGIDRKLAASVISETVNISNAITESKISTPQDKIMYWNKTLDGFEIFGMNVGFIRARLNRLSGLTYYFDRYKEAKAESKRVKEKIVDLKKEKRRLNVKSEVLKKVVDKRKAAYEEEANAPW